MKQISWLVLLCVACLVGCGDDESQTDGAVTGDEDASTQDAAQSGGGKGGSEAGKGGSGGSTAGKGGSSGGD
ncbi:MAG TPA: hypothetical protein VJV78_16045, partial [Polyangiales bacterium]|nr:hypothetical protein [Polyangiales bacterium]